MGNYFCFKGNLYGYGTVVKINEKYVNKFKFNSNLLFVKYDKFNNMYHFQSLYNMWETFTINSDNLYEYIDCILKPNNDETCDINKKIPTEYVDGIVSGVVWYIIATFCALFLKGFENTVYVWAASSFIFFIWLSKKRNGE